MLKQLSLAGLLGGLCFLSLLSSAQSNPVDGEGHEWWQHAVFYEIYPRSFADSNNNGIGDLNGDHVETRLPQRFGRRCDLAYAVLSLATGGLRL